MGLNVCLPPMELITPIFKHTSHAGGGGGEASMSDALASRFVGRRQPAIVPRAWCSPQVRRQLIAHAPALAFCQAESIGGRAMRMGSSLLRISSIIFLQLSSGSHAFKTEASSFSKSPIFCNTSWFFLSIFASATSSLKLESVTEQTRGSFLPIALVLVSAAPDPADEAERFNKYFSKFSSSHSHDFNPRAHLRSWTLDTRRTGHMGAHPGARPSNRWGCYRAAHMRLHIRREIHLASTLLKERRENYQGVNNPTGISDK